MGVGVTADGLRAVSASMDKTLRLWDLGTGSCLRVLEGHTEGVRKVLLMPTARFAVSASLDQTLRVWDLEAGLCVIVMFPFQYVIDIALSCMHNRIIVGTSTGEVHQYDLRGMSLTSASQAS